MDLNRIETVICSMHSVARDTITVGDLMGTDAYQVAIDLAATPGGGAGDGVTYAVIINGSSTADRITVSTSGQSVLVTTLAAQVSITGAEAANDSLTINGLGGDNIIDASALAAGQIKLTINGPRRQRRDYRQPRQRPADRRRRQ